MFAFGFQSAAVEAVLRDDISVSIIPSAPPPDGKAALLRISPRHTTFLRFEFDSVLPEGTTADQIAKATLRLWGSAGKTGGACSVSPVMGPWSEFKGGIFPKTLPVLGQPAVVGLHDLARPFMVVDVTAMVRDWISGTPNWGLAIHAGSLSGPDGVVPPMNASFDSKKNRATGHLPTLQIVLRP